MISNHEEAKQREKEALRKIDEYGEIYNIMTREYFRILENQKK